MRITGLGATRKTCSLLVNRRVGISPGMTARLSKACGRTLEAWLQMQYDLAQIRQRIDELNLISLHADACSTIGAAP